LLIDSNDHLVLAVIVVVIVVVVVAAAVIQVVVAVDTVVINADADTDAAAAAIVVATVAGVMCAHRRRLVRIVAAASVHDLRYRLDHQRGARVLYFAAAIVVVASVVVVVVCGVVAATLDLQCGVCAQLQCVDDGVGERCTVRFTRHVGPPVDKQRDAQTVDGQR
jgi:hypothetical protein